MSAPEMSPPPGGDVTRAPTVIAAFATTTALALICLAVRLYVRVKIVKAPGLDDLILIFSMFFLAIPNLVCTGIQSKYGLGRHIYYVPKDHVLLMLKWGLIADPFGTLMTCIPKFAVVIFLHKCLARVHQPSIYALYGLVVLANLVMVVNIVFLYVRCHPVHAMWTAGVKAVCWNPNIVTKYSYFVGAVAAFSDLVLALYPLTFVPRLQMRVKQKIALCCVMGLGVFACACAIARTTTLGVLSYSEDITWNYANLLLWCGVEGNVIVICASLPATVPLFFYERRSKDELTRRSSSKTSDTFAFLRPYRSANTDSLSDTSAAEGGTPEKVFPGRITARTDVSVEHGQP